ncbi:MAG TPA: glycosyltransferase family 39 protein [Vicinamibacteria bacterium]|nr:glycosyltransferase family 39 protein [Vicinamibacteria bacterium]
MRALAAAALGSLLLAAAVRLPGLGRRGLASSEQAAFVESQGFSTRATLPTGRPLAADALPRGPSPSPAGAGGLALWTRVGGTSETALRLPAALAGVLTAALAALVAGGLAGPRAAAWAGTLLALSPIHTLASRQAGPEALLVLAVALALALLVRVEKAGGGPSAIALGLVVAILAASGVAACAAVAVLALAWLALRPDRRRAAGLAAATFLVLVAGLTVFGLARSPLDAGEIPPWVPETTASGILRCAGASFTRMTGLEYHLVVSQARFVGPLTAFFVGLMAWGAARLPRRTRGLLVAGAASPFLLGIALALASGRVAPLQAHRLVAALPFLVLLAAGGLASWRDLRAWVAGIVAVGTVATFLALALARPGRDTGPTRNLAREVARCRPGVVAVQRPLDLLSLAAWGVPGPFFLRGPGMPLPEGPAVAVGPSSACVGGGATCGRLPACPAD